MSHRHTLEHIRVDEKTLAKCVSLMEDLAEGHGSVVAIRREEKGLLYFAHDLLYDIRHNIVVFDGAVITKEEK